MNVGAVCVEDFRPQITLPLLSETGNTETCVVLSGNVGRDGSCGQGFLRKLHRSSGGL